MEKVILIDENDLPIGEMEKMEAHVQGLLHRAISVFIINSKGEWLLHRRAMVKYHSKGLWTNTSCSHPFPGEPTAEAALRRLRFEMNLDTSLEELFHFTYKAELENGLTEHEVDHVFVGYSDELPVPNPEEVMEYKYISVSELNEDIDAHPEKYTEWFKLIYQRVQEIVCH
jgi:isopentenyl-diphosphate delta-isomerase